MNIEEYVEKMKKIQECIINYLESEDDEEENYQNILNLIKIYQIYSNREDLKMLLRLIVSISNNHHRVPKFFKKIEQIFLQYSKQIKEHFTNDEIFQIIKKNKRIILFFIQQNIIIFDKSIAFQMFCFNPNQRYYEYFTPEIKPLFDDDFTCILPQRNVSRYTEDINREIPENFEEKRQRGENDNFICEMIQKDQIDEFISFVNQENYSLNSLIEGSILETNHFLLKKDEITLIEYAAFHGSIQIFKYLFNNGARLNPLLWLCAIHGDDEEIIHIIEERHVSPPSIIKNRESFIKCYFESIKCHHNHIANYIKDNLMDEKKDNLMFINFKNFFKENIYIYCFRYYNFVFLPKQLVNIHILLYACRYDYFEVVKYLLETKRIDINEKRI